jgi:hypothetical protein
MPEQDRAPGPEQQPGGQGELLQLRVDAGLYRAFHRCLWIRVHETGCTPVEVMEEMVRDFLGKHGC